MQQMRHRVVPLDRAAPVGINCDAHSFARLGRATVGELRAMDEHISALLRVEHGEPPDLGAVVARHVQQAVIADLSAHLRVAGGAVEHDVQLAFVLSRRHGFDDRLGLEKIVAEELRRLELEVVVGDADDLLFLRGARASALLVHEFFKTGDIDGEPALASHQFGEIEREALFVV